MIKQVLTLSKVQLKSLFGINEVLHTKDKKKKQSFALLSVAYVLVILMAISYVGGLAYGYHYLGLGDIVPMYLYTILSILMLVLSFFKAGSVLFSMKSYDIMVSLPVTKSAILISRFVTMYVTNLLFSLIVMIPGLAVHIWFAKPGISFYIISLMAVLFAPLLPLTISSILGALIKGISSRMKNKTLVETFLTVGLVVVIMVGSFRMGPKTENLDMEALKELIGTLTSALGNIFPPALWYHQALQGSILHFVLLLGIPALIFTLFVWILSKRFTEICTGLNATYAKHNYKLGELKAEHVLLSLFKKEMKLYFSSSLYVTNSGIGYILAVLLAGAIAVMGVDSLAEFMEMPMFLPLIHKVLPFVLAMPLCMMSTSACTVSMEGKTFWQLQVLPVKAKDIYNAKLLWNLAIAAPFYLISVVLMLIGAKPALSDALHYFLIPLVLLAYCIVLGLACNLWFPKLNWDNEAQVVKQGAAVLVSMLGGVIAVIVPAVLAIALQPASYAVYYFVVEAVILVITGVLYYSITKKELITISR
ncbi:MAG: hypothetical protein J6J44_10520 [Lachnospiraceae bacterium]|nr:hypothetical protein [Lachnospiraceae bacterium]